MRHISVSTQSINNSILKVVFSTYPRQEPNHSLLWMSLWQGKIWTSGAEALAGKWFLRQYYALSTDLIATMLRPQEDWMRNWRSKKVPETTGNFFQIAPLDVDATTLRWRTTLGKQTGWSLQDSGLGTTGWDSQKVSGRQIEHKRLWLESQNSSETEARENTDKLLWRTDIVSASILSKYSTVKYLSIGLQEDHILLFNCHLFIKSSREAYRNCMW